MVNKGLLYKSYRETRVAVLGFGLAFFGVEWLLAFILPSFAQQIGDTLLQIPFMRPMLTGLLGMDPGDGLTGEILSAFAWAHPAVLAIVWTQEITFCTRFPAGELDRGALDMMLAMPVSRWSMYRGETLLWLISGVFLMTLGLLGNMTGTVIQNETFQYNFGKSLRILLNFFALYLAVGGISFLASAWCNRKSRALSLVFGVVAGSFILNFAARLWEPASSLASLSLMNYYQPMEIGRGVSPLANTMVLFLVGLTAWVVGGFVFRNKDVPAG